LKRFSGRTALFDEIRADIEMILNKLKAVEINEETLLYIVTPKIYMQILKIDHKLLPYRTDSRRGKEYNLSYFINILNDLETVAFTHGFSTVERSELVTDQKKTILRLPVEFEVNKNKLKKELEDLILNKSISSDRASKLRSKLSQQIEEEKITLDKILNNPNNYKVIISGYEFRKIYHQVFFHYLKGVKKVKTRVQKHLSVEKSNILVFNELNDEFLKSRSDKSIDQFILENENAFGKVYYKSL